ncbi:MAG: phosphohydrolase [Chloroflexota bacterium]|nr:MAG: phosphohydrolase [Chloroflexota bacterium]
MANNEKVIELTEEYVYKLLSGESSGHDWWHTYRVWKNTIYIGKKEKVDLFVAQLAALLHDIADWKFYGGDHTVGPRLASEWLAKLNVEEKVIEHVCSIILNMNFKGTFVEENSILTLEGMVVQDADRLDAIGAIGIGRTFAYGGHKGREMYNPNIKPRQYASFEEYKNNTSPTINHFHEKLLLLKDLMNTETARQIAVQRHTFMLEFLAQFFEEWKLCDESNL